MPLTGTPSLDRDKAQKILKVTLDFCDLLDSGQPRYIVVLGAGNASPLASTDTNGGFPCSLDADVEIGGKPLVSTDGSVVGRILVYGIEAGLCVAIAEAGVSRFRQIFGIPDPNVPALWLSECFPNVRE